MDWQSLSFLSPLAIATGISVALSGYLWRRRAMPGASALVILLVGVFVWASAYLLELTSPGLPAKIFWERVQFFGVEAIPLAWLALTLEFTRREGWLRRRTLALLAIIPVIALALIWTNEAHGLMYRSYYLINLGPFQKLDFSFGPMFWVNVAYSYGLLLFGIFLLIQKLVHPDGFQRGQVITLLLGMILPLIFNVFYVARLGPYQHLDLTPFLFAISGLVLAWGLYRYRIFDVTLVARDAVIENMREGVLVLDDQNRILDLNPVAETAIGQSLKTVKGKPAVEVLSKFSRLLEKFHNRMEFQEEVVWGTGEAQRYYDVRVSPLRDQQGNFIGRLIIWSDSTDRKPAERALRRQLKELSILHAVAIAGAEAISEDALIERATKIIGDTLYPDDFGIFLLNEPNGLLEPHLAYRLRTSTNRHQAVPLGKGICGWVAREGKSKLVTDVNREPTYFEVDPLTLSELCVPLKVGERVIGVINAESIHPDAFNESDERLLATFAGQLATAIDRLRSESAERHRTEQLAILNRASQEIIASLQPEQVYVAIHQAAAQLMPTDAFLIALMDEVGREINLVYFVDRGNPVQPVKVPAENGLSGHVIATGEAMLIEDREQLGEIDVIRGGDPEATRSILAVPLRLAGRVFGMLSCQSYQPHAYSQENLQTLSMLANQASIAIENARLFEETQRRLEEIIFLSQIISVTATESDLPSALQRVCTEIAYFFQAPEVGFELFNAQFTAAQMIAEYHRPDRPRRLGSQIPVIGNPVMTHLLETGKYLIVENAETDPLLISLQDMVRSRGITTLLMMPIIFGGDVVGLIEIAYPQLREFTTVEIALVEKVASQISQVLERLGLFAATREQAERMAELATISEGLTRPLSVEEVISGIGSGAMALGQADRAALYLRNADGSITAAWSHGLSQDYLDLVIAHLDEVPGRHLLQNPEPVLLSDLESLPENSYLRNLGQMEAIRAVSLWPLVYEGYVIAAVGCYFDNIHSESDAEQEVMLAFARQAAVALQNARLFDETRRRAAHLEALNAIIARVTAASDLEHLLGSALDHTLRALGLRMGYIWVAEHRVLRNFPKLLVETIPNPADRENSPLSVLAVEDWQRVTDEDGIFSLATHMVRNGVCASLTVPIVTEGRRIGGLSVACHQPRAWLPEEIALMEGVGKQLGGAAERVELQEKIQEHAQQVQQIMDTVPEGVVLLDSEQRVLLANPVAQDYLIELAGTRVGDILGQLGEMRLADLLKTAGQDMWVELEISDPLRKVFELAVQPLAAGEQSGGWVFVLREVTQERENQARIQMQERLATVGQLAAGIAHDFNNILAAIVVYADLLKREQNLPPASRERLNIIQQQVQRAASLIRQILDFSRRSVMEQSILDLLPFIKELDKLLRRVLPETIRLELTYKPGVYMVSADPSRLQQVFMNLAVNASDAAPVGGVISFILERIQVEEGERLPCPGLPAGSWIRITVKDTGEGIPPDILPHIFEPFYTTKPVGQGTGLGLAQAYGIIKQHDGFIDAHSQIGEGTTFHIYLPEEVRVQEDTAPPERFEDVKGAGETLLVVEDDNSALEAMRDLLESYNYQVLTAMNGKEALHIYEQRGENIDLIVSDIVMPVMGGVALYQALQDRWPGVKMLFVTGHPMKEQDYAILEQGNVHWLQKPFSVQAFSQVVSKLLNN